MSFIPARPLLVNTLQVYSIKLATIPTTPRPIATTNFSLPLVAEAEVGRAPSVVDERLALALDTVETMVTILLDTVMAVVVGRAEMLELIGEAATVVAAGAGAAEVVGAGAGAGEEAGAGLYREKSDGDSDSKTRGFTQGKELEC